MYTSSISFLYQIFQDTNIYNLSLSITPYQHSIQVLGEQLSPSKQDGYYQHKP